MIQISSNTPGQTSSFLSYHDEADNTLIKSQHKFLKRFCCLSKSTYGHYIHDVLGNTFIFFVLSICSSSWSTHSRILLVLFHLFFSLLSYPLPTPACHLNDHEKPTQRVFGFSLGLVLSNWKNFHYRCILPMRCLRWVFPGQKLIPEKFSAWCYG